MSLSVFSSPWFSGVVKELISFGDQMFDVFLICAIAGVCGYLHYQCYIRRPSDPVLDKRSD